MCVCVCVPCPAAAAAASSTASFGVHGNRLARLNAGAVCCRRCGVCATTVSSSKFLCIAKKAKNNNKIIIYKMIND